MPWGSIELCYTIVPNATSIACLNAILSPRKANHEPGDGNLELHFSAVNATYAKSGQFMIARLKLLYQNSCGILSRRTANYFA